MAPGFSGNPVIIDFDGTAFGNPGYSCNDANNGVNKHQDDESDDDGGLGRTQPPRSSPVKEWGLY